MTAIGRKLDQHRSPPATQEQRRASSLLASPHTYRRARYFLTAIAHGFSQNCHGKNDFRIGSGGLTLADRNQLPLFSGVSVAKTGNL